MDINPARQLGFCSFTELSVINYILESNFRLPWEKIDWDGSLAYTVQIGNLPSALLHKPDGSLSIMLILEDETIIIRPFNTARLELLYQTITSFATNPIFPVYPKVKNLAGSLKTKLVQFGIDPTQVQFEQILAQSLPVC